jgi:muramoyltetrapeptide carboxypeptidase
MGAKMTVEKLRIAVVAPANRLDPAVAERVTKLAGELYAGRVDLRFHPQCHLSAGHFAGDDVTRAAAFLEVANDRAVDAVWFARGGYGSCRIAETVLPKLTDAARRKTYLGYSDMGSLMAGLYARGFRNLAHGPMPTDIARDNGEAAVRRALAYLVERAPETLEPSVAAGTKCVAFNLLTLSKLIGTPLQPDLAGHVLMVEEVAEYMYRIDRSFFHLTSNPALRRLAGIRLGRCSAIPANDPDFGQTEEEVARHWCKVSGIAYLGRADIGHDADNKIVPFGEPSLSS